MSNAWNINNIKKIAGLPLTESVDDNDDELSPAERALADKADADLKKGKVKVGKVNPDKDLSSLAKREKSKESKAEADAEADERSATAEADVESKKEKAEAPHANPKTAQKQERKAKAAEAESKAKPAESAESDTTSKAAPSDKHAPKLRKLLSDNPSMSRSEFLNAAEGMGASRHYASGWLYNPKGGARKKAVKECFFIRHPMLSGFVLAENREMSTYQWVDAHHSLAPMMFVSEAEAESVARHMREWKNQQAIVESFLVEVEEMSDEPRDKEALNKVSKAKSWLKANPDASMDAFVKYCTSECDWAATTAHTMFNALKK